MNPNFLLMIDNIFKLHVLLTKDEDDSPEGDQIRDESDPIWHNLSKVEKQYIGYISEKLFIMNGQQQR